MATEIVGLGASLPIEDSVSSDSVWKVLLEKIQNPQLFLPVEDVISRTSDDGLGTYREMTIPSMNARMIENIYVDKSIWEVKFVRTDTSLEHVNIITDVDGVRKLEFYQRDSITKERVPWHAPKEVALGGISKVLKRAKELP